MSVVIANAARRTRHQLRFESRVRKKYWSLRVRVRKKYWSLRVRVRKKYWSLRVARSAAWQSQRIAHMPANETAAQPAAARSNRDFILVRQLLLISDAC